MTYPTISQYNQILQKNGSGAFRTLTDLNFIASRTFPVKIYSYGSGSYAVVFKAKNSYNEYAIRCFISAEQENIDRYRKIDNYLKKLTETWVTKIELLENEINVAGNYYPVIKMDWIEGKLLNAYINQILPDNKLLYDLQEKFVEVSRSLEANKIGHGDIQCGNVIIASDATGKALIKLIDYDGMYIPAFLNKANLERGRAEFQHPNRSQINYNEKIDRFSFWIILCAIEALKFDKSLWLEVMQGGFNTLDNLLFVGEDFISFNNSKLVNRLYALNKPSLTFYLDKLKVFCNSSASDIEPPFLFDSTGKNKDETIYQSTEPINNNNNDEVLITSNQPNVSVLTSAFEKIGNTPIKINKAKYLGQTLTLAYGTQFKQIKVTEGVTAFETRFNKTEPLENNVQQESISPVLTSTNEPPPIISKPKKDYSIIIILIIAAVLLIALILVVTNQNKRYNNPSYTDSTSTTTDSTAMAPDSSSMMATDTTKMDADTSLSMLSDTTKKMSSEDSSYSPPDNTASSGATIYEPTETESLTITKYKVQEMDTYSKNWKGWPDDWTYANENSKPTIKFSKLNNYSDKFKVETIIDGEPISFIVSYESYDDDKDWYKYEDETGNEVYTRTLSISSILKNGWGDDPNAQIYLWIYTKNMAIAME